MLIWRWDFIEHPGHLNHKRLSYTAQDLGVASIKSMTHVSIHMYFVSRTKHHEHESGNPERGTWGTLGF